MWSHGQFWWYKWCDRASFWAKCTKRRQVQYFLVLYVPSGALCHHSTVPSSVSACGSCAFWSSTCKNKFYFKSGETSLALSFIFFSGGEVTAPTIKGIGLLISNSGGDPPGLSFIFIFQNGGRSSLPRPLKETSIFFPNRGETPLAPLLFFSKSNPIPGSFFSKPVGDLPVPAFMGGNAPPRRLAPKAQKNLNPQPQITPNAPSLENPKRPKPQPASKRTKRPYIRKA